MNGNNQYSVFIKDGVHYCIPIDNVREVVRVNTIIPSPIQLPGFTGFIDFRETLCPVLDIYELVQSKISHSLSSPFNIIVIEHEEILFSILIDKFIESINPSENIIQKIEIETINIEKVLINKVFRYKEIALYRLDLNYLKNFILRNIDNYDSSNKLIELNKSIKIDNIEEIELICFTIEKFLFGIPITETIEVIEGYGMQPLFRVNKFLRGLINLRGQIIACVDISEILGLEPRKMEEKNQFILIQNGSSDLALCIDVITKKQLFQRKDIQNVESIFSGELSEYLLGVVETSFERIFIISGSKIFESKYLISNRE